MMDEPPPKKAKRGAPLWLATFADLMSLLMCFFVLLLSFSETDAQKYKEVAGSMAKAFGIQRETPTLDSPMGTSFVSRDYSPGRPDPKPIKPIQQETGSMRIGEVGPEDQAEQTAHRMQAELTEEVLEGLVQIETEGGKVIVRIREKGSFASGSATLMPGFKPALTRIGRVLRDTPGQVVVAGHTDDIPISGSRFRSNWELSTSRAVTVVHEILGVVPIPQNRFTIAGHGEFQPVAPNDTAENRAKNRRVEIILEQDPGALGEKP